MTLLAAAQDPGDALFEQAISPAHWQALAPELHVGATDVTVRTRALEPDEIAATLPGLRSDGYLEVPTFIPVDEARRLATLTDRLHARGWPTVFAFVYDEPWHATARLRPLLSTILGENYRRLPDFWAWRIAPTDDDRGWAPHRDRVGSRDKDGNPTTMTVWVALTAATPLNGCMYVLPAARDPHYRTRTTQDIPRDQLQNIRALVADAGSVLAWNQEVYHWGARSSVRAREPRMSFACEFQRGDVKACNSPLLDPVVAPPFALRLRLISKQIVQYQHMYNLPASVSQVARRILQR